MLKLSKEGVINCVPKQFCLSINRSPEGLSTKSTEMMNPMEFNIDGNIFILGLTITLHLKAFEMLALVLYLHR